jgi:hypothetical protein
LAAQGGVARPRRGHRDHGWHGGAGAGDLLGAGSGCGLREENRHEDAHPLATRGLRGLTEEGSQRQVAEETRRSGGLRRWRWAPTFSVTEARRGGEGGSRGERLRGGPHW